MSAEKSPLLDSCVANNLGSTEIILYFLSSTIVSISIVTGWLQTGRRGMTAPFTVEEKLNGCEVNAVSNQQTTLGG